MASFCIYSVLTFFIGVLVGFKDAKEQSDKVFFDVLHTFFGVTYLFSRGVITFLFFVIAAQQSYGSCSLAPALGFAVSFEALIKAKFVYKNDSVNDQLLSIGLFNAFNWYQKYFLSQAMNKVPLVRKKRVSKFVKKHHDYDSISQRVATNLNYINDENTKLEIAEKLKSVDLERLRLGSTISRNDHDFLIERLCSQIAPMVTKNQFNLLFRK